MAALYKQQLGEVIKERRETLGLTQKDLADRANVEEPQTVSRWERGLNSPTDLDSVAKALDTTVDELLRHLKPIGQKERRRLLPRDDERTQLDRIEAMLRDLVDYVIGDEGAAGRAAAVISRGFVDQHEDRTPAPGEARADTGQRSGAKRAATPTRSPRTRKSA